MQQGPGAFAGAFSAHRVREGRVLQDAVVDPGCFGHGRPACRAGRHDLPRHSPVFPQVPRLNHIRTISQEAGNGCAGLFVVYPERCRNSRTQKGTEKRIQPSTTKSSVTQMSAGPAQAAAPEGVGKKGGECQDDEEQLHGATPFRRCGIWYVYCNVPGADGQQNRGKGKVKPAWRQRLSQKSGNDGHLS